MTTVGDPMIDVGLTLCYWTHAASPEISGGGVPGFTAQPGWHTREQFLDAYALRLMEKQKLRFHYGLSERQLRRYVAMAFAGKGNSGHMLLSLLERRLDNVCFRAGYAPSMAAARRSPRSAA